MEPMVNSKGPDLLSLSMERQSSDGGTGHC